MAAQGREAGLGEQGGIWRWWRGGMEARGVAISSSARRDARAPSSGRIPSQPPGVRLPFLFSLAPVAEEKVGGVMAGTVP